MENNLKNIDLSDRYALKRIENINTELEDISIVEYRKLRLERVILVGVSEKGTSVDIEKNLEELASLAITAGSNVLASVFQKRLKPDASTFIGKGKVDELKLLVQKLNADTVIADGELSPAQLSTLEKTLNIKVIDRTALILDIFAQHAKSREGKVQIELAQLEYLLPRLRGWGETLSRQAGGRVGANGGVGLRGPGETKLEIDRRRIRSQISKIKKEIAKIKKNRITKNVSRNKSTIPKIAILGYTNVGKSSLLNLLSNNNLLVEDALFATLDPTARKVNLSKSVEVIISDTVGFVQKLPTQLVEAFRSTLDEINFSDLLLIVVDASSDVYLKQFETVQEIINSVLEENFNKKILTIFNKSDLIDDIQKIKIQNKFPESLFISTKDKTGIEELKTLLINNLEKIDNTTTIRINKDNQEFLQKFYSQEKIVSFEEFDSFYIFEVKNSKTLSNFIE